MIDFRSTDQQIEDQFSITLPNDANNLGYHLDTNVGLVALAKFTIDETLVDSTLKSVRWKMHRCLREPLIDDYYPKLFNYTDIEWWIPGGFNTFSGLSCYAGQFSDTYSDTNVLVEYDESGNAIVYIEQYIPVQGKHPYE